MKRLVNLLTDRRGVAAIEYALISSLIALGAVSAIANLGSSVSMTLNNVAGGFDSVAATPASSGTANAAAPNGGGNGSGNGNVNGNGNAGGTGNGNGNGNAGGNGNGNGNAGGNGNGNGHGRGGRP